jgi:DNA adenine methylase
MNNPPALRYFGGKHRDAHRVIAQFPQHEFYCEIFGGGASVLLQKQPATFEVYNDLSGDVVNFFKMLRDRPDELIRAIQLTPYSRLEKELAYELSDDDLERARRLYIRSWQGFGGGALSSNTGWRFMYRQLGGENVVSNFNRTDHLWLLASRLKLVQIECDEAIAIVQRYGRNPNALIYADPPYVHSTRTESGNYDHEMTDADHKELSEALHSVDAMCLISGYDCELYRELYKDWQLIEWSTLVNGVKRTATECLWISPNCVSNQLPLMQILNRGASLCG